MEDIQLGEDFENEVELAPEILHKNNYKTKDLNNNIDADKVKSKDNNFTYTKG